VIRVHRFTGEKRVEEIDGVAGHNVLAGTDANNVIDLSGVRLRNIAHIETGAGDDRIFGSTGDDVVVGGSGRDVMKGAEGDDLFLIEGFDTAHDVVSGGDGFDRIAGGAMDDVIRLHRFRGDNRVEMIDGGGGMDIIMGTDADNRLDFRETELRGIQHIEAGQGNDVVFGSAGDDVMLAGAGDDRFVGGAGNDTYVFGRGDGVDVIRDRDRTPNTDRLVFGDDIDIEQIWFRRVDDSLTVSVIGTGDQVTIENWFRGGRHQVEEFLAVDGQSLLNSQVDNLVNAMAAFSPPPAGEMSLAPDYQEQLSTVIAANWQ
jgi:Ca2+-binding RTX toxin-like protein